MAEHICQNCSTVLDPSVSYCEQCGENNPYYVKSAKKRDDENQPFRSSPNPSYYSAPYVKKEGSGTGWFILGFFIPIFGLIMYFVFQNDKPVAANRSITGALIGFIIFFFFV